MGKNHLKRWFLRFLCAVFVSLLLFSSSAFFQAQADPITPSAELPDQESSQRYAEPHSTDKTGALPDSPGDSFPMLIIAIVTAVAAIIALLICYSKYQEQQFQRRWEERKQ